MPAPPLTFEPWSAAEHLDAAADLLMARHRTHRADNPDLPQLGPAWARELVARSTGDAGFVAVRDGRLVGYLIATAITERPRAGFAWADLDEQAATDIETTRSLYAHAAEQWVAASLRQHVVHVPAVESLLWPWFLSTFGVQHTWALRDTSPLTPVSGGEAVVARRIGPDEASRAGQADRDLSAHLQIAGVQHVRTRHHRGRDPGAAGVPRRARRLRGGGRA